MTLWTNQPPSSRTPYAIPQLEGERITIPGSKGTFRILASAKQTNGLMAVFQSGAVLSDAPGFHYHNAAHDVFLVAKGYLKLWNGDKCRIMGAGDFAYVPPGVIHNPEMLGPHTEIYGLITPGDWVDFFRYIAEPYEGVLVPESDTRDLKALLLPKVLAAARARERPFDVVFQPDYVGPDVGEWSRDANDGDERLPDTAGVPFFLRANTGPRWMLGGVLSRPFITTTQSGGVCAISSIESSSVYGGDLSALSRFMRFRRVDHCLAVMEGTLGVRLRGGEGEDGKGEEAVFREGETVVIPAGRAFALRFQSRYVRVWSFADGDGIEALVQRAGEAFGGVVLPEQAGGWDPSAVRRVAEELDPLVGTRFVGPSGLVPRRPATGAGRRNTDATSCTRARSVRKKVEELNAKLRAAESRVSSPEHPAIDATPRSMPADRPTPTPRELREQPSPYGADPDAEDADEEITELNHHTNGIEFHGSTSSVAFLGHLQKARDPPRTEEAPNSPRAQEYSIVSTLHNASFSPTASTAQPLVAAHEHNYYFEHAHLFMSGYFENIHFVHPFIDKEDFYRRAQDLWLRRNPAPDPSFVALYLSVLSFGALLRVWDEVQLGGLTRFEWSRKLFGEAQLYLNHLHFPNNLDAVQCLYLMAKICQNELNPNLAYMYLGLAVRTCLAAGFNRKVRHADPRADWISRTWWGLFSLEIEMSFSLGRPDTLGMDEYHNRPLPARDNTQYAIIPWMVDFAQITRKVSVQIYHRRTSLAEKLDVARAIEAELDGWVARLPGWIRPDVVVAGDREEESRCGGGRNALRDPKWARRQRVVLGIRYYNVKMLLFRPFLNHYIGQKQKQKLGRRRPKSKSKPKSMSMSTLNKVNPVAGIIEPTGTETETETGTSESMPMPTTDILIREMVSKCLDAAEKTIAVIHDIYRLHTFFRCWWYNTTYITFATSTLLLPLSKPHLRQNLDPDLDHHGRDATTTQTHKDTDTDTEKRLHSLRDSVNRAIDLLDASDESVVARKCAELIRCYLREFERGSDGSDGSDGSGEAGPCGGDTILQEQEQGQGSLGAFSGTVAAPGAVGEGEDFAGGGGYGDGDLEGFGVGFDIPEWAYGFGFPDCSFEGVARFFDDLGGLPILDG
ncbi:uncharacterized protein BJX67DRAFT_387510 [Aspergillus lucknowensis]|uniref:Xylanolytic transcriptional activator regulatory domain-containing protein n=1 Tax=Aspergillus lucknowensis TaxID=176173 RepID=A0ABR4LUE6_9EURO